MKLTEILSRIFPGGTVKTNDGFEVSGLAKGSAPQNCRVLASVLEPNTGTERREHYLVRIDGVLLFFCIRSAQPGSGYDELVVGRKPALLPEEQAQFEEHARGVIDCLGAK